MPAKTNQNKIAWISILQAITIAAVIIGHIDLAGDMNPKYPIACWIERFQAFQMPVFFFISGFLYVRSSLYNKSFKELIISKWWRLGIPFLFMSILMYAFKLCLPPSTLEHPVSLSFKYALNIIFVPWDGPVPHIWFLMTLFIYFLLTPLYKLTFKNIYSIVFTIVILILVTKIPQLLPYDFNNNILCLRKNCYYGLYFYLGMLAYNYNFVKLCQNFYILFASAILYTIGIIYNYGGRLLIMLVVLYY